MNRAIVIVDFVFDDGLLFVSVANIGDAPAIDVVVEFDQPVHTADGAELGAMALFRRLTFLAPGKNIMAFVDSSAAYFGRGEPEKIAASIRWRDLDGETARSAVIRHDLGVYRDLPFVPGRPGRPGSGL
ncbi:MAG TPA: hypothetical protein VGK70_09925 [Thermoanaerobaculia bacterium]